MTTNNDADRARALERVRKMLRLANDAAASEGERDNALRMAHATLAKWNLDLADASGTASSSDDATRGRYGFELATYPWNRAVCAAVGRLLFCEVYFVRSRKNYCNMYFVGRGVNAQAAIDLAQHLIASVKTEARAQSKIHAVGISSSTWELDFCKGASERISKRCTELRKYGAPAELAKTPGTALVLANHYDREREANAVVIRNLGITLRARRTRQNGCYSSGLERGREHGNNVQLQRRLS